MKMSFASLLPGRLARHRGRNLVTAAPEQKVRRYCAVMCEVDYYRQYVDIYGGSAGDAMIGRVRQALLESCARRGELLSRNGDSFVMIVPAATIERARMNAEQHRFAVEQLQIPHQGSPFGIVTLSLGIATIVSGDRSGTEKALRNADAALVQAKRLGRNRVAAAAAAPVA